MKIEMLRKSLLKNSLERNSKQTQNQACYLNSIFSLFIATQCRFESKCRIMRWII